MEQVQVSALVRQEGSGNKENLRQKSRKSTGKKRET